MCGVPAFPPIATRYASMPPAPAPPYEYDVLHAFSMGSAAPSKQQQLLMMAEAARGRQMMRTQRLQFAPPPAKPDRRGDLAGSPAMAVPTRIKLRCVSEQPPEPDPPPPPSLTAAPPRVEVRRVWAHNFDAEARLIESLLPRFRYAAVDTEFPGTVYRPAGAAYTLTPERRYELLRQNVDALDLIQLGLTLFDAGGGLPFDVRRHRHAPESIALLRARGVDFDRTRRDGVGAAEFGPRLRKWLRAGLGRGGVVTFSGGYDLAYLVKVMFGGGYRMPGSAGQFEGVAKAALARRRLFDVKEMARRCPRDLRGGLESVAVKLNVGRAVGEAHQAGSDSLLTCHTFMKMRESYFDDDDKLARVAGFLTDVTAC
ncbi:probable CCR4-associated factor 1 homolog 9 [Panicum virgatum]|uniref:probable CCR4-associated factor 1 homolog 9 n=1 Tax=Panicum virgatum TaxID=38727 RepID=UPI0019D6681E|nr:probable CCR4-associated factor 1 homolog 9 [Panicum virgatum]